MTRIPDGLPLLSAGRHRRKRHGVCLMEYTSILAGEHFSDHPRCTDPVLAAIARTVNDYSSANGRQRLAVLASDLTAVPPASPQAGYAMARRCLLTALPYSTGQRRHVIVVGLLGLDRAARGEGRGWRRGMLDMDTELGLLTDPAEVEAAADLLRGSRVSPSEYVRRGLPVAIECAVRTIAREAPDADRILARMLTDCIEDVRCFNERDGQPPTGAQVPSASCAGSSDTSVTNRHLT